MINHALINAILLLCCLSNSVVAVPTGNLRGLQNEPECTALMKVIDFSGTGDEDDEAFDIECEMSDDSQIIPIEGLPNHVKNKFKKGEYESAFSIIKAPGAKKEGKIFKIPPGALISIEKKEKKDKKDKKNKRDRHLESQLLNTLAIWTQAPDSATTTPMDNGAAGCLTDEIFGTYGDTINLKSQYDSCSKGKLQFEPANGASSTGQMVTNGVYGVSISQTVNGVSHSTVRNAIYSQAQNDLGSLSSQYDHVMFCIPPGTSGNWIAYAYVNHWLSVYNDKWCNYVSAQMHEVGHNLNLAHSGEGSASYADQSGMMGYSYASDNAPKMCFNSVKNVQLGLFTDREVILSSSGYWKGNIYGIASYDGDTSSDKKMIIRLDDESDATGNTDFYISYNAKVGINSGTAEGGNKVLIHRKEGNFNQFGQSWLLSKLGAGGQYNAVMTDRTVPITVLSINTGASPPYAVVEVGNPPATLPPTAAPTTPIVTNPPTVPLTASPTTFPSSKPTVSPVEGSATPSRVPSLEPSAAPSMCFLPAITPYADSYIYEYNPTRNYGTKSEIQIKNGNSPYDRRGLMRFDTSEFWSRYENRGHKIVRAYLKCLVSSVNTRDSFNATVSRMGPNDWTETGVKWDNLLSTGQDVEVEGPSITITNPTPGTKNTDVGYVTFDITDLIEGDDLILYLSTSYISSGYIALSSREGSSSPEIYFEEPNAPCLSMAPSTTPSEMPSLSLNPSLEPSAAPSSISSNSPSNSPSLISSIAPSTIPSVEPTISLEPSAAPSKCFLPTLTPYADSYIFEMRSDINYGTSSRIVVKNGDSPYKRRGLMRFDTSEFWSRYENRPPHQIVRAYLKCHVASVNTDSTFTVTVSRMGPNTWTETGVTWNNLLSTGQDVEQEGPSVEITNPEPGIEYTNLGYVTFDITDLIVGDDLILSLFTSPIVTSKALVKFSSRESSNPPEIYFEEPNDPCLS